MKYVDPAEQVFIPLLVSVRADTARLLREMASELEVSIDELFSCIAEDSAINIERENCFFEDVLIPDRCSSEDLLRSLNKKS